MNNIDMSLNANSKRDILTESCVLTERDFYPPYDNRIHRLGIDDIPNGDTYEDYLIEFWEIYEDELFN